jgi:hypothetical protein
MKPRWQPALLRIIDSWQTLSAARSVSNVANGRRVDCFGQLSRCSRAWIREALIQRQGHACLCGDVAGPV